MNNSSGKSIVPCGRRAKRTNGQADRHDEANGLFLLILPTPLEID